METFLLETALPQALRAAALLAVAILAARGLARRSAALRHRVWTLALIGVLLLPLAAVLLPSWGVLPALLTPAAPESAGTSAGLAPATESAGTSVSAAAPGLALESAGTSWIAAASGLAPESAGTSWVASWVVAVWALGFVVCLGAWGRSLIARGRLGRRAVALGATEEDAAWQVAAEEAARTLGVTRPVALAWSTELDVPVTWGAWRPRILLPALAREGWNDDRRRVVLLHEMAHVARWDSALFPLARFVVALHWFNPLAWRAFARLQAEAEHAADDRVLTAGVGPARYAGHLVSIARALRAQLAPPAVAVAMARAVPPSALERRIGAILAHAANTADRAPRCTLGVGVNLLCVALAALVLVPLGTVGCVQLGGGDHYSFSENADDGGVLGYFAQPRLANQCDGGMLGGRGRSATVQSNAARQVIKLRQHGCKLEIDIDGAVGLDETGVTNLASGSSFEAVETSSLGVRDVRVTAGPGGQPEFRYRVGGDTRPFEGEGAEFLTAAVQEVFRSTEVGAKERVARLQAAGGVDAVLAEVEKIFSGYVRHVYLRELLTSGKLSAAEITRVLPVASRLSDSDYDQARTLETAFEVWPAGEALPQELFAAAQTLESDYERAQVLQKVAKERAPIESERLATMAALSGLESDYDRGQVLHRIVERQAPTANELPALLSAAQGLESDYEHGQLLRQVIESRELADGEALVWLGNVRRLESDYDRAELLIGLAGHRALEGSLLDAFVAVAEDLDSDHDRNRALAAALRSRPRAAAH